MSAEFTKTEINIRFPHHKPKAFTLSYDDGVLADVRLVELCDQYQIKGTFNINSGQMGVVKPRRFGHERLGADVVAKLYTHSGHEVAMHTLTHPFLTKMDSLGVAYEVLQDKINLESLTGTMVRGFAYPYGAYNDEVIGVLKSLGVAYARTIVPTGGFALPDEFLTLNPTCHHFDPKLMDYAEQFVAKTNDELVGRDAWLFYVWGHAYEFEDTGRWEVIENLLQTVSQKDDVWYATNIEICDYIKDFRRLVFNAQRTQVYNPSSQKIYFERMGKSYSVNAGETIDIPLC